MIPFKGLIAATGAKVAEEGNHVSPSADGAKSRPELYYGVTIKRLQLGKLVESISARTSTKIATGAKMAHVVALSGYRHRLRNQVLLFDNLRETKNEILHPRL